jgi:predicted dithiol-disulfide oxidoreductase (DUF899 family)
MSMTASGHAQHRIGTQKEWQAERDALLKEEKELTRRARGLEPAMAYYGLLDRTPKGRDESASRPLWVRRHDEYGG